MLFDWLSTPEAQADSHYWLAVLAAHALVGAVLTGLLALLLRDVVRAAAVAVAGYLVGVEGAQVTFFGGGWGDGAVDAAAVTCGAVAAAAAWRHRRGALAAAAIVLGVIGALGARRRR